MSALAEGGPSREPSREPRFWTPGFLVLMAGALAALIVLVSLGNWQVRRMAWKEDLLATIDARRAAPPISLDMALERYSREGDVDYTPVRVEGTFGPEEALVHSTDSGQVGWQVLAPLELADGRTVIVNRGFVPDGQKLVSKRPRSRPPAAPVVVTGLARDPILAKPNRFVPENDAGANVFYWKDYQALRAALGLSAASTVGITLDAGPTPSGVLPRGGQTIVELPNNHFGYAVTWYGIALGLVGVVFALVLQRLRRVRGGRREPPGV